MLNVNDDDRNSDAFFRHADHSMILVPLHTPGVNLIRPLTVFGQDGEMTFISLTYSFQALLSSFDVFKMYMSTLKSTAVPFSTQTLSTEDILRYSSTMSVYLPPTSSWVS